MEYANSVNNLFKMQKVVNSAIDYVVLATDVIVNITNTSVARTVTLPAPVSASAGKSFTIKDASGGAATNHITILGATGNIDGSSSSVISNNYEAITYASDGSNYYIIGSYLVHSSGTWTPDYNGTTPGIGVYTLQLGNYVKSDKLVVATFQILLTSTTASGDARIEGLPFSTLSTGFSQFSPLKYKKNTKKPKILGIELDQNGTGGNIVEQSVDDNADLDIRGTFSYISS